MTPRVRVLFVGRDSADAALLGLVLAREFPQSEVAHIADPVAFGREIERAEFDLVVCDEKLSWGGPARVLSEVRSRRPRVPVVFLTEAGTAFGSTPDGLIETTLDKSSEAFLRVPELLRAGLARPMANAQVETRTTREAEREFEHVGPRIRGLLDRSRIGVFRLSIDGRLLEADNAFLSIVGATSVERARELDLEGLVPRIEGGSSATGEVHKRELRLQGKDGEIRVAVSAMARRDEDGRPVFDGLLEDIGARRRKGVESDVDVARLLRSNEDLRMFASLAAHELKEPLRTIEQSTRMLLEDAGPVLRGEVRQSAELIVGGVRRLQSMVEGLLSLARFDASDERPERCDCNEIVDEILESLQAKISGSGAQIEVKPLPTVRADPTRLRLVFRNVISNAIQFHGDREPRIRVAARQDGDEWVLSVKDQGVGIASEDAERIFERFARLGQGSGAGLGLAISKHVVEGHGGRIWVESEPDSGSTFLFTIPLTVAQPSDGEGSERETSRTEGG